MRLKLILYFICSFLAVACSQADSISVNSIIKNYNDHKNDLQAITSFFIKNNKLGRIDKDHTAPDNPLQIGISETEINKIKDLMVKANIAIVERVDDEIRLITTFNTSEKEFGYSMLISIPKFTTNNIDTVKCAESPGISYKKMKDQWFVFVFCTPK